MKVLYRIAVAAIAFATAVSSSACVPGGGCSINNDCGPNLVCSNAICVPPVAVSDTTPPVASIASPAASSTVHGTATVVANASDDVGVTQVALSVDGALSETIYAAPYNLIWDTTGLPNGAHTVTVTARDAAGNLGSSSATYTVLNGAGISIHTRLGLPGPALADGSDPQHFLAVKNQYVVSYNGARREPNWVAWELNTSWMGAAARQNDFRTDGTFPGTIPQASLADYANSGFDRGHMCPSEDRTDTVLDNQSTFFLTNMIPQLDNVNGGPWAQLEAWSRTQATAGKELFIVSGGVYAATPATIGTDQVAVPSSSFKVIVVLDQPGYGVANVSTSTQVIAVLMPNDGSVAKSADWTTFKTTVANIESQSGLTFLSDVRNDIRATLEATQQ